MLGKIVGSPRNATVRGRGEGSFFIAPVNARVIAQVALAHMVCTRFQGHTSQHPPWLYKTHTFVCDLYKPD